MEENKENVVVSEKEMEQINQEITQVEQSQIEQAKKEGAEEAKKTILPTMEEIKKRQEELERKIAMKELEEKERLLKEMESKPIRRGVVPESSSPFKQEAPKEPVKKISNEDAWAAIEAASRTGSFRASVLDLKR